MILCKERADPAESAPHGFDVMNGFDAMMAFESRDITITQGRTAP
jgi:hypothetical protein